MNSLRQLWRTAAPHRIKHFVWCLTDAEYRATWSEMRKRVRALQRIQERATEQIWDQTSGRIVAGPFAGMNYLRSWKGHTFPSKLLGTYEKELWPVIEQICHGEYAAVIDIGSAEGYYACGLALRMKSSRLIAFESQSSVREAMERVAQQNGLAGRIEPHGMCTIDALRTLLPQVPRPAVIICDIEGAEKELLCPRAICGLAEVDLLVEVHEELAPGVSELLERRFAETHHVQWVDSEPRSNADLPPPVHLEPSLAEAAMDECRGVTMQWLWLRRPRSTPDGGAGGE